MKKKEGEKKKEEKKEVEKEEPFIYAPLPKEATIIESYEIEPPFSKVSIAMLKEKGYTLMYFVDEIKLTKEERASYGKLVEILSRELTPPKDQSIEAKTHILNEVERLTKKYRRFLKIGSEESLKKIHYYVRRDLLGYGPIHVMINDPNIEDISCNGIGKPVYVWHKKYESLASNLSILSREAFNDFVIKLAHLAGRHISTAFPIVDAMLPGKHRLAATYGEEVSTAGSTFTIRKFREEPFSIIDLIKLGTLDSTLAAYFWLILENRLTVVIIGGTGAGKTTFLNALTNLFKPGLKIVTVEETAELNIPHENWVQFVSRSSYGLGGSKIGEVTMFDLVRTSLRYRPDYLIVGEVRGEEAFVMFQAIATGHGGLCTLHAENIDYAIKRLTSRPMNIDPSYIPLMNVAVLVERVVLPKRSEGEVSFGRRVRYVWEIQRDGTPLLIASWNPTEDRFEVDLEKSIHLKNVMLRSGKPRDYYLLEIDRRKMLLDWMIRNDIRHYRSVAKLISQYYSRVMGAEAALERKLKEIPKPEVIEEKEESNISAVESNPGGSDIGKVS